MISSNRRLLLAVLLAVFCAAAAPAAQTSDPGQLQRLLKPGDTVAIVDLSGTETPGQVERINEGVLEYRPITPGDAPNEVRISGIVQSIPVDQIAGLTRVDLHGAIHQPLYQRRDSFATLKRRLLVGQVVRVVERSGNETTGTVNDLSPSALVLAVQRFNPRDGSRTFPPALVERIERPDRIWDGGWKGAATVAALIFLATAPTCGDCPGLPAVYAAGAGIGASIGLGLDAAFRPKKLYRAPK